MAFSLTMEQQAVVADRSPLLKIIAYAGTGKTTTLQAYAENYSQEKMLYLAFNKSIQQEAFQRFPRNVMARTAHSLAYQALNVKKR